MLWIDRDSKGEKINFELMMNLWKIYRPVWQFLLVFFGTYGVFSGLYFSALDYWASQGFTVDPITNLLGAQLHFVFDLLGFEAEVAPWTGTGNLVISVMGTPVAQLVEGCNAVSVMILFAAFVFAIPQKMAHSIIFIVFGFVLLYGINIARIALISIGIYLWPEWTTVLHDLVFPGIIYGTVLLLWILWIWRYKSKFKTHE